MHFAYIYLSIYQTKKNHFSSSIMNSFQFYKMTFCHNEYINFYLKKREYKYTSFLQNGIIVIHNTYLKKVQT